jgi:spore coat protein U-like protein
MRAIPTIVKRSPAWMLSLLVLLVSNGVAAAASQTTNLSVTASVAANCTIATATLAFGAYDPVGTNSSTGTDLTGTGTVTISCTKGAVTSVELGLGANASGSQRRLTNGTDFLNYDIFQDGGHTTAWGTGTAKKNTGTSTSKAPVDHTTFGLVPKGQDPGTGSYTDTVVATVNF